MSDVEEIDNLKKRKKKNKTQEKDSKTEEKACINYTEMLYKDIGTRVRKNLDRFTTTTKTGTTKKMSLESICNGACLDKETLSRIQSSKAEKGRNTYLIPYTMLTALSKLLDIDEYKLVWGDEKNQDLYVKTWLLAILINGAESKESSHKKCETEDDNTENKVKCINPFCCDGFTINFLKFAQQFPEYYSKYYPERSKDYIRKFFCINFSQLVIKQKKENKQIEEEYYPISDDQDHEYPLEELRQEAEEFFLKRFGFFAEQENYERYDLLDVHYDAELIDLSDAILKLLLEDYKFTTKFVQSATTKILNQGCLSINDSLNQEKTMDAKALAEMEQLFAKASAKRTSLLKEKSSEDLSEKKIDETNQKLEDLLSHDYTIDMVTETVNALTTLENRLTKENLVHENLNDLLLHPSKFILEAMDYKGENYVYFMDAFNSMWKKYKYYFMKFFKNKFFANPTLVDKGLKEFSNKKIDEVIKSKELLTFVKALSKIYVYSNPEIMLANTYFMQKIQAAVILQYVTFYGSKHYQSIYKSIMNSINETENAAQILLEFINIPDGGGGDKI